MIYLAADIHGHVRLHHLRSNLMGLGLSSDDFLIILGDAGIIWGGEKDHEVVNFYNDLECMTLFLDGNHENFTLLNRYPVTNMFGGSVHRISDKIAHLRRGEMFEIDGRRLFVFGGGFSSKKLTGSSPVLIWDEEMPNDIDYSTGTTNVQRSKLSVDYVLTHEAPTKIIRSMGLKVHDEELPLTNYLQRISEGLDFHKWYFGHYHKDWTDGRYRCLYDSVIEMGE